MEVEPWIQRWRDRIENPEPCMHTVVAERGGVVGFSHLGLARDTPGDNVGELYAIYVLPDTWGGGVGQALMAETLARLRGEDFAEAILWVLEDNPRTRRFYELAGWRADGGAKEEEWLGTTIREVRYRIDLR
jgi:GNAT superfamily N-acetyltransferase